MVDIDKQCSHYIVQCIALFILLNFLASVAMHYHYVGNIVVPVLVSSLFVLVLEVTAALVWRWVAKKHSDMLPSFFTAVSGFRFLVALMVMAIWYLASGRQEMMTFIVVFLLFYMVSLIHHSIFFSRIANRL